MQNNDFKYVIQDITHVYMGAKYTYGELMEKDEVPFKLRAIISHYMLKEVGEDTTVESHIFHMGDKELSYMVYKQMRVKFRLKIWEKADGKKQKKDGYVSKTYVIEDIVGNFALKECLNEPIIEEIVFTKIGIMSISL